MKKELVVIKFGTASITKDDGSTDIKILGEIARQVSVLHKSFRIVIVSSGAVGAGKQYINKYEGNINQRKAAAAIGNPLLLKMYADQFQKYNIIVAQSLLERQHFADRNHFLQLKATYEELWINDIIPIANENDVVSNRELKFSDNDELATLIATGFGANRLLLCTVSGGLLDNSGNCVSYVKDLNQDIWGMVKKTKSDLGLGGMASKLTFTNLATRMGIKVTIFGMKTPDGLTKALNQETGTTFEPKAVKVTAKNKWMASGGLRVGKVYVDAGACKALTEKRSLLAVGIIKIEGSFSIGEIIEIVDVEGSLVAMGKSRLDADTLKAEKKSQNLIVAHVDDMVLM